MVLYQTVSSRWSAVCVSLCEDTDDGGGGDGQDGADGNGLLGILQITRSV